MQEFIKGLRNLAQQNGWLIERVEEEDGINKLIIFRKENGELQRIATIIVKAEDNIVPEVAEGIVNSVKKRLEDELADSATTTLKMAVRALFDWMVDFFS